MVKEYGPAMNRSPIHAAALAAGLASCTTPPDEPVLSENLKGDYTQIGACAFTRLDRKNTPGTVKMVDLRGTNTIRIYFDATTTGPISSATFRHWDFELVKASENTTRLEMRATPTVWGKNFYAREILPDIKA